MMMDKQNEIDLVVISFGTEGITNPRLDALCTGCVWEHIALPAHARRRMMEAVNKAIHDMSALDGTIMREETIWEEEMDGFAGKDTPD